jgi:hypothetical protein
MDKLIIYTAIDRLKETLDTLKDHTILNNKRQGRDPIRSKTLAMVNEAIEHLEKIVKEVNK